MPIADDSVDMLWCHHVLEHVEDDLAAIQELFRIARRSTGELIVSVPMVSGTATREYGFADKRESGHWRIYGDDFKARLSEVGFTVETISNELSPDEIAKYGLIQESYFLCRKL